MSIFRAIAISLFRPVIGSKPEINVAARALNIIIILVHVARLTSHVSQTKQNLAVLFSLAVCTVRTILFHLYVLFSAVGSMM